MTGKADFTEEEWKLIREAPTSAGMIVILSQRGGATREMFEMAKVYAEVRQQHGQGELLDAIVAEKPEVDRERQHSPEEFKQHGLQHISDALALVQGKASADEVEQYKGFILSIAQHVAERVKGVSESEHEVIGEIARTVGAEPPV